VPHILTADALLAALDSIRYVKLKEAQKLAAKYFIGFFYEFIELVASNFLPFRMGDFCSDFKG